MKTIIATVSSCLIFFTGVCQQNNLEIEILNFKGNYFGQPLPDSIPLKFNPFISDKAYQYLFFNEGQKCIIAKNFALYYTKMDNDKWDKLDKIQFENYNNEGLFAANISPDGKLLYYNSLDRKLDTIYEKPWCPMWISEIEENKIFSSSYAGFGGMYPSVTNDGSVYFTLRHKGVDCIAKKQYYEDKYQQTEILPAPVFSETFHDQHPFISPDENYLIFDSENREKINNCALYISFKEKDNSWSEPINLGKYIKQKNASMARITDDGKYIFYSDAESNVWWVSTVIIEKIRKK